MPDVKLAQHWADGVKIGVWPRTGEWFPGREHLGKPVATVTVHAAAGDVVVKGLDLGRYWAAPADSDGQHVAFVSKDVPPAKVRVEAPVTADPQRIPGVRMGEQQVETGPRGTKVGGRYIETPVSKGVEAHPSPNQASVAEKTPQRSSTLLGQATPVDPDERQPKPSQGDVPDGAKQRSDTELGESTEISDDAGPTRQEDYKGPQRSATETGEATPIGSAEPRGTSVNPSAEDQAEGVRPTGGHKPERSAKSDTKGANPEVKAEGRSRPRPARSRAKK